MKQDRNPVRRAEAPKPPILSQNKKPEFSLNPGKYAGNYTPPPGSGYEPSMELEMLQKQRKKEVVTNGHVIRQHQQPQRLPQQQHGVTTGNRYNLDCQSCMLVQMGEKVLIINHSLLRTQRLASFVSQANYGLPCDTCGNALP